MNTTELATPTEASSDSDQADDSWVRRLIRRLPDPLTSLVVVTVATFALLGIGSPLIGAAAFAGTDTLGQLSPQRDEAMAGVSPQTINMGDTVDSALPNNVYFGEELRDGEYAQWNPYILGGVPMGATPNFAVLSPVALPFWILPGWLAPGYMRLLEIIVAVGGCYLFLRRFRLEKASALLGGLVFASSGFLIVWTNWPQTRVTVFVPVLFWALERLVQRRRATDVALVALPVAAMILGGFPSVTGYALLTGGCYFLARSFAEYAGQWRRLIGLGFGAVSGVLLGVALVAFQLLPFVYFMTNTVIRGRGQGPGDIIPPELLLTSIAPYLFGSVNPGDPPMWFHVRIFIEESFYVGGAALVLVGIAIAAARKGRALLPRGVWFFLLASTGVWTVLIFHGGWPLALLQKLPVLFSHNFVGRGRSVLGFLLAVLAAVGFQLLLNRWRARRDGTVSDPRLSPLARAYGIGVWLVAGLAGLALVRVARRIAYQQNQARNADGHVEHYATHMNIELAIGLAFVAAALLCAAYLWWGPVRHSAGAAGGSALSWPRRYAPAIAAGVIPVLVGVQALALAAAYHPRTDREHFYPMTNAAAYLEDNLGHERYFGASGAIYGGIEVPHRIRALHGHAYLDRRFSELVETMPGTQFDTPPTYLNGTVDPSIARHPVLDRLAVTHYMVSAEGVPYGEQHVDNGDGTTVTITPGTPLRHRFTASGPLRGIGFVPQLLLTPPKPTSRIQITLRDGTGRTVAEADKIVRKMAPGTVFYVPLAAEQVTAGTALTVEIGVTGPVAIPVAARAGAPAVSTVTSVDDGLRLVYDDSAVIYQRSHALPRVRWASDVVVEPDAGARLKLLSTGGVGADQVVLDAAGPAAEGKPAQVTWLDDGVDEMSVRVSAQGAGYLVVADAIQRGWSATVDGEPAELVPADHGIAAVAVPAGEHTVRLAYTVPYGNLGGWISGLTALLLVGIAGVEWWRRRPSPDPAA